MKYMMRDNAGKAWLTCTAPRPVRRSLLLVVLALTVTAASCTSVMTLVNLYIEHELATRDRRLEETAKYHKMVWAACAPVSDYSVRALVDVVDMTGWCAYLPLTVTPKNPSVIFRKAQ